MDDLEKTYWKEHAEIESLEERDKTGSQNNSFGAAASFESLDKRSAMSQNHDGRQVCCEIHLEVQETHCLVSELVQQHPCLGEHQFLL